MTNTLASNPLQLLGVSDDDALEDFEVLTRVAAMVTGMPNASISFADTAHMWAASGADQRGIKQHRDDSYCAATLSGSSEMLVTSNVRHDPRTRDIAARRPGLPITSYAGVQLKTDDGQVVGTFCVTGDMERELTAEQLKLLQGLARQAMNLLSLRAAKRQLTESLASMTQLATVDGLTGMLTRRAFHEEADDLRKLVLRQGGDMSVVVLDIDFFKRINDRYGHAAGDTVLREVAATLRAGLRSTDRIGRIGGEEFAIAMPFTGLDLGLERVDQLRHSLSQRLMELGSDVLHVTVSGGVADVRANDASVDSVLQRADEALYRAKASGRNQIKAAATGEDADQRPASAPVHRLPSRVRPTDARPAAGAMTHGRDVSPLRRAVG